MKIIVYAVMLLALACTQKKPAHTPAAATAQVQEKSMISLSGGKQYVEMTGASDKKPVLLFIHGGPGWPQTPQLRYFNAALAQHFIVVAWDQAGCGLSPEPKQLSLETIVQDAHELTALLKRKFNQPKIYLAGYSWGSVVGMNLAQRYPDDYLAYAGIAQVINIGKGMQLTQQWLADTARKINDTATLNTLAKLKSGGTGFCNSGLACFMKQYELLGKYKGAVYNQQAGKEEEQAVLVYDDYKAYDWMRGFNYSTAMLERDMFSADFTNVNNLGIPVVFFQGRHDWNVPSVLVQEFEQRLRAPSKKIVWFEQSGHSPLTEEAAAFNAAMVQNLIR